MPNHLPGRRTVLLAGLAGIAGCTIAPPAGQQGGATSGGATSPTPGSDPSSPSPSPSTTPTGEWRARVMTYNVLTAFARQQTSMQQSRARMWNSQPGPR